MRLHRDIIMIDFKIGIIPPHESKIDGVEGVEIEVTNIGCVTKSPFWNFICLYYWIYLSKNHNDFG